MIENFSNMTKVILIFFRLLTFTMAVDTENQMLGTHWSQTAQDAIVEFRNHENPTKMLFLGALIDSLHVITPYSLARKMLCNERNYFARVNLFNGIIGIINVKPLIDGSRIAYIELDQAVHRNEYLPVFAIVGDDLDDSGILLGMTQMDGVFKGLLTKIHKTGNTLNTIKYRTCTDSPNIIRKGSLIIIERRLAGFSDINVNAVLPNHDASDVNSYNFVAISKADEQKLLQ